MWRASVSRRLYQSEILKMQGTLYPHPPADTSPFKGRLGGDARATVTSSLTSDAFDGLKPSQTTVLPSGLTRGPVREP